MSKTTEKLAELLQEAMPEYSFDPKNIKTNPLAKSRYNTDEPIWIAEGRIYTSFLRYTSEYFYGQDLMKQCSKGLMVVENGYKMYEVYPKSK